MPVTGFYCPFFFELALTLADFQPVVDTRRITDDQGWAVIGFCFFEGLHELVLVGAHSDLSDIDVAVLSFHHAQVFLTRLLTGSCELSHSCRRRSFRCLAARIGVDFCIKDQDVDIFTLSQDMVQAAITDIVSPAVATKDPLAAFD